MRMRFPREVLGDLCNEFDFHPSNCTPFCGRVPELVIKKKDRHEKYQRITRSFPNWTDGLNVILPQYMQLTQEKKDEWLMCSDKEKACWLLMTEDVYKIAPHSEDAQYACLVKNISDTPLYKSIHRR